MFYLVKATVTMLGLLYPPSSPVTSVVHASGTGKLQTNPPEAGPRFFLGESIRRVVNAMGYNDMVVGEDNMEGPDCLR